MGASSSSSRAGFDIWEAVGELRDSFGPRPGARMGPRMGRGDVRTAILVALAEEPMHGYQVIQAIEARTNGAWKPSPGSVYPTLQLLADEGLVTAAEEGERKVYSLTEAGRESARDAAEGTLPWEARAQRDTDRATALPKSGVKLAQAIVQVSHSATPEQSERAVAIIDDARRKLYAILAED